MTKEKKTLALLKSFRMSTLLQHSSLVLLALECGIQSVLRTCTNQSCVTLTAAMVKEKGPEHAHVVQQEEPKTPGESTKVKCKYCELVFTATATRIRAHLLGWTRSGVRACDKVPLVVTH